MKTVKVLGAECTLEFGLYQNGTVAITAYHTQDNEPWCTPTVNWEEHFQGVNYAETFSFPAIVIKDYSENEGVYNDLITASVVEGGVYLTGSNRKVRAALLTDKWQAIAKQQLNI